MHDSIMNFVNSPGFKKALPWVTVVVVAAGVVAIIATNT